MGDYRMLNYIENTLGLQGEAILLGDVIEWLYHYGERDTYKMSVDIMSILSAWKFKNTNLWDKDTNAIETVYELVKEHNPLDNNINK